MRSFGLRRSFSIVLLAVATSTAFFVSKPSAAQENAEADAELVRQQKIAERFLSILEKNPRRGTALDKVYGFHVENGTLDQWIERYTQRVTMDPKDGPAWMMLALVQSHRGQDAAAVNAFAKATELLAQDPLPAYYLGQSLVLVGQPEKAVEAFETAIQRKPAQNDLLEIFQALGRVHQRAQRSEEALAVWTRLEKLFPNDSRVQEQIVATLVEEGQFALALPRYEALLKATRDDYRRSVYRMEAAELKVKLNRSAEAIDDLEKLLASLNPSSWLHREVRRKIEDVFLRTDDQDGLAKYYEGWVKNNPEDVDAMARLARILARQARVPEAQAWLDKALKLAPSRKELRLAFIEQLVDDQRYPEAIAQYEVLDKSDPNNPDYLRERGKLILRDTTRPKEERLKAAEQVWRRMAAAKPKDPLIATQVADLLRHSQMNNAALELYRKAVELAPSDPQYREYLGEFYHQLERREEALATWRPIAVGKLRTATNVARLAEVLSTFGYLQEATVEIEVACKLDPKDFSLHLKAADLLIKAQQYEAALQKLDRAETLSQNDEEAEGVLATQLKVYQLDESLANRTDELELKAKAESASAETHYLLARHQEAQHQFAEAISAVEAALKLQPKSIPSLATAARVYEQAGDLTSAASLNRRLAVVDRRGRSDYLKKVSQLETQLGRTDQALAAGQELLVSAPGNTENLEFYADLCFRLGKVNEGLETLRKAVRLNPGEPNLLMRLANALTEQFRTDEAIEIHWQAYDKAESIDDKLNVVQKLADLHLETNHLDRLLERLERQRADADAKREATICLAQVYHTAGDYGMARQELESLLSENTRDTQLLQQLSKLAEAESDLSSAVKYQEQLAQIAPGPEADYRLATLLARDGQAQQSAEIIVRLAIREEDPEKLLRNIDSLLATDQKETALLVIERRLRDDSTNWELLYRKGVALKSNPEAAKQTFAAILQMELSDSESGIAEKNRLAKAAKQSVAPRASTLNAASASRVFGNPLDYSYQIRAALGLSDDNYYPGGSRVTIWTPANFGQARLAALGWHYVLAGQPDKQEAFKKRFQEAAEQEKATPRELWDWLYVMALTGEFDRGEPTQYLKRWALARRLAEAGDPAGQYLFLTSLNLRSPELLNSRTNSKEGPPLSQDDMDLVLQCYQAIRQKVEGTNQSVMSALTGPILAELRRCGREEEEQKLFQATIAQVDQPEEISQAIVLTIGREDVPATLALFDKWSKLTLSDSRKSAGPSIQPVASAFSQFVGALGAEGKNEEVLKLLDHYLDHQRSAALKNLATRRTRTTASSIGSTYISTFYGKRQQSVQITFPTANQYYDSMAIHVLRNAYEVFKRNDLMSDFQQHLAARRDAASGPHKVFEHLAAAYIADWNDEPQRALEELHQASELASQDARMRLELARYHIKAGELDEALEVVDGFSPTDQDILREREVLALELAVRVGDRDRARQAAERLFGLRLDPESQVQLADQMRRLGMNEHAEAVLSRAQRQAGNRLTALVALMNSHQSQGKSDVAVQIAHQILRRSRTSTSTGSPYRGVTSEEQSRQIALQVLGAAGKLKEMIAAAEQQLQRSPQATQLYDTLAEYHEAAGDRTKALEWQGKIIELRPDDVQQRFRYANKLLAAGKHDDACKQFETAIRKQPNLLRNQFYEISQAFRQANKPAEFAKLLGEVDLSSAGHYHYVMDHVQQLLADNSQRKAGLALMKRAWETFPTQRQYMLSSFYNNLTWEIPEIYDYGRQSLLPNAAAVQQDRWYGLSRITSYNGDGHVNTVLRHVLQIAEKKNRLAELRKDVETTLGEHPSWEGGRMILAVLDARAGKVDAAEAALQKAIEKEKAMPGTACRIVAQELENVPQLRPLVVTLYEKSLEDTTLTGTLTEFQYGAGPRLVRMYNESGRREDALRLLVSAEKQQVGNDYDPLYAESQRISHLRQVASLYKDLDFKVDALRLYRHVILRSESADPMVRQYGSLDHYKQESQRELTSLTDTLRKSSSAEIVEQLLVAKATGDGPPTLDLMIAARTEAGVPKLDSQLLSLLGDKPMPPEQLALARARIQTLCEENPGDIGAHVVAIVLALQTDVATAKPAIEKLTSLIESQPLKPLAGKRANARERGEAEPQIPLWFAAKACSDHPELNAHAEQFASRAVEAARRLSSDNYVSAILFTQSKDALSRKKPEEAERHLRTLLEVVASPLPGKPLPGKKPIAASSEAVPMSAGGGNGQSQKKTAATVPPLTLSQFQLVMTIAELAAENKLVELAQSAARQALAGGLPVPDVDRNASLAAGRTRLSSTSSMDGSSGANAALIQAVAVSLNKLSQTWQSHDLPAESMYDTLHELVLPAAQPKQIELFPRNEGRPVGSLLASDLVHWAVAAEKADELRDHLRQRAEGPAKLRAMALLVELATRTGDQAMIAEQIDLAAAANVDTLQPYEIPIVSQAATVAFRNPKLRAQAVPLLERLQKALSARQATDYYATTIEPGSVSALLASHYASTGDYKSFRRVLEDHLTARQAYYARFSGGSSLAQQRSDTINVATRAASVGQIDLTLDYLAKLADLPDVDERYGQYNSSVAVWHLAWQARQLPVKERYQRLKQWTLPTEQRRTLRFLAAFTVDSQLPPAFTVAADERFLPSTELVSNFTLLVDAAKETGSLPELAQLVERCVAEKLKHADTLAGLIAAASGSADTHGHVQRLAAELRKRKDNPGTEGNGSVYADDMARLLILDASLNSAASQQADAVAPHLLQDLRRNRQYGRSAQAAGLIALHALNGLDRQEREQLKSPGLRLWTPGTPPGMTTNENPPAWWTAHDKYLAHIAGFEHDSLYFNYPLIGTFEFSFEAHGYDFSQGQVAYGGLLSHPQFWASDVQISPISRHESVTRGATVEARDWWNRYSVKVSPNSIRFYSNGHLVYEETEPSPTSPWLNLVSLDHRRTVFRNLRLTGSPTVPAQVNLTHEDRLEGWTALPTERLPPRIALRESNTQSGSSAEAADSAPVDWQASDGVIYGRMDRQNSYDVNSRLQYHRPLQSGEKLSYEFFYAPGRAEVHPAIGRLAFLLEPDGVRLHWLTSDAISLSNPFGLSNDNRLEEPANRRGPNKLPLNAEDWNRLQLALDGDVLSVRLNDVLIYQRPLEPVIDRRFSLFHFKNKSVAEVRNVLLHGNWPQQLTDHDLGNLLELANADESPALTRARHALVREEEQVDEVYDVLQQAASLPPEERLILLAKWVLPGPTHPTFRLQSDFLPIDAPLPAAKAAVASSGETRNTKGAALSPAIELVRTAAELNKLDELASKVMAAQKETPDQPREALAMHLLLSVAKKDDPVSTILLGSILQQLKELDGGTPAWQRHAEFTAVLAALERPQLQKHLLPIAELLVENQHSNYQTLDWERRVRWLRAKARWQDDPEVARLPMGQIQPAGMKQWTSVSQPTAATRGRGLPLPTWRVEKGKADFFTGSGGDALYFRSPLTGNFEVRCRRTTFGWKEIRGQYGGVAFDVHHEGKAIVRQLSGRAESQIQLNEQIPHWGPALDYRLVVQDGGFTVFMNDKQVHSERLPEGADPWLCFRTAAGHFNGSIEDVRILGNPTVPESIDLSASPELLGWDADYYGDSVMAENSLWTKEKGEVVGRLHANAPGSKRESLLRYHRPLLEDGTIEYEFFYAPGKTDIAPALGRTAFILRPDGVFTHRLTDGAYDRTGLDPANLQPSGSPDKPLLKAGAWNTIRLQLTGNLLKLTLNDVQLLARELDPDESRQFGFFRFADEVDSRIRNVIHRGDWPKTIPPVAEQELAAPHTGL